MSHQLSAEIFYSLLQNCSWLSGSYFCLLSWCWGIFTAGCSLCCLGGDSRREMGYAGCRGHGWEDHCLYTCPGGLYLFQQCQTGITDCTDVGTSLATSSVTEVGYQRLVVLPPFFTVSIQLFCVCLSCHPLVRNER